MKLAGNSTGVGWGRLEFPGRLCHPLNNPPSSNTKVDLSCSSLKGGTGSEVLTMRSAMRSAPASAPVSAAILSTKIRFILLRSAIKTDIKLN
jgi:hypothetical protein